MRRGAVLRRSKIIPVRPRSRQRPLRAEVMRKAKAESSQCREPGAEIARAQDPDRRKRHIVGQRADRLKRVTRRKTARTEGQQLVEQFGEIVRVHALDRAPQRQRRATVRTRRAAEAQIDPARVQRLQRVERLGDAQRCVVRQHDAAGPDADPVRHVGDMANDHLGRRADDTGQIVMFPDPVAAVPQAIGQRSQVERVAQRAGAA